MPHTGSIWRKAVAASCGIGLCAGLAAGSDTSGAEAARDQLEARLVSYWSFEGGDSVLHDIAGRNQAVMTGGASRNTSYGGRGAVLDLEKDGSSAVVAEPSGSEFERTDAFSISAWLRMNDDPKLLNFPPVDVLHRVDEVNNYRGFDLAVAGGKLVLGVIHTPGNAVQVMAQEPLTLGEWHHIVVAYDGSSRAQGVRIYIDGRTIATDPLMDNLTGSTKPAGPLVIGTWYYEPWNTHMQFRGQLDDVAIWRGVLDEDRVQLLYRSSGIHVLSEPSMDATGVAIMLIAASLGAGGLVKGRGSARQE